MGLKKFLKPDKKKMMIFSVIVFIYLMLFVFIPSKAYERQLPLPFLTLILLQGYLLACFTTAEKNPKILLLFTAYTLLSILAYSIYPAEYPYLMEMAKCAPVCDVDNPQLCTAITCNLLIYHLTSLIYYTTQSSLIALYLTQWWSTYAKEKIKNKPLRLLAALILWTSLTITTMFILILLMSSAILA